MKYTTYKAAVEPDVSAAYNEQLLGSKWVSNLKKHNDL